VPVIRPHGPAPVEPSAVAPRRGRQGQACPDIDLHPRPRADRRL